MAFKFALLAAFCVAQAFAFPSSSEGLADEPDRAVANKDLQIAIDCFKLQDYNLMTLNIKLPKIAQNIVKRIDESLRESAENHLEKAERPVAKIGFVLLDTHRTMYTNLNNLNIVKAYEALMEGVHTIEGIMHEIRSDLNKVKVEHPELTHAMNWYMRSLSSEMDIMIPKIRRDYGMCLAKDQPSA